MSGCMTMYQPPGRGAPAATFNVTQQEGLYTYFRMEVTSIDNQNAGPQFSISSFKVHPGVHDITMNVRFRQGFWAKENVAVISVYADFKNNENYHIVGTVNNDRVLAWVTDQRGTHVSTVKSATYSPVTIQTVYISHS